MNLDEEAAQHIELIRLLAHTCKIKSLSAEEILKEFQKENPKGMILPEVSSFYKYMVDKWNDKSITNDLLVREVYDFTISFNQRLMKYAKLN